MNYQAIYTNLRTAKMSFSQFMNFLAEVHALGVEKGAVTVVGSEQADCFAAAPLGEQFDYRANQ